MNKKVNFKELAKKAIRKAFEEEEYSTLCIDSQLIGLTSDSDIESFYNTEGEFREFLNTRCPFFKGIDVKANLSILLKALEDAYTEKYKNLEKENLKPTQVAFIIFGMETFHSCTWVINDLTERMKNFPIGTYLVAQLYVLPAIHDSILEPTLFIEYCKELNKAF